MNVAYHDRSETLVKIHKRNLLFQLTMTALPMSIG